MPAPHGSAEGTELEALLVRCLELPEEAWPSAIARAYAERPDLAPALERRLEVLRSHGLVDAGLVDVDVEAPARERIGDYRLLRRLGSGGMGIVYLAWSVSRAQPVALKLLLPSALLQASAARRFKREMEIASGLSHPAICEVLEVGEAEGTLFIAMRFVNGPTLAEEIAARRAAAGRPDALEIAAILGQFEALADALAAAHDQGLVHRDVKPANVLLDEQQRPLLVDFGLARRLDGDSTLLTAPGARVGTPGYMAPEALEAGHEVGPRADVYSLGACLYERLTLRPPFEAPTLQALVQRVTTEPEPDPRRVHPELPRALGLVVRTAMARDPDRRYRDARAFGADLAALREGRAIAAREPHPLERLRRWARRNPWAAALCAVLLVGLATVAWLQASLAASLRHSRALNLAELSEPVETGDPELSVLLARAGLELREDPITLSRLQAVLADFHASRVLVDLGRPANVARYSPSGRLLLAGRSSGELVLFEGGEEREQGPAELGRLDLGGSGARYLGLSDEAQVLALLEDSTLRLWTPGPGERGERVLATDARAAVLAASGPAWVAATEGSGLELVRPDGRVELAGSRGAERWTGVALPESVTRVFAWRDSGASVWDSAGRLVASVPASEGSPRALECSPDGRFALVSLLAAGGASVRLFDVERGELGAPLPLERGPLRSVAFAGDGERFLVIESTEAVRVFDVAGRHLARISAGGGNAIDACFDPESARILVCNGDGVARLYSPVGDEVASFRGHTAHVLRADVRRDGREVATASYDGTVRTWSVAPSRGHVLDGQDGPVTLVDVAPDESVLTGSAFRELRLWGPDLETCTRLADPREGPFHAVLTADGERILAGGRDGVLRLLGRGGESELELDAFEGRGPGEGYEGQVAISRDGSAILATGPREKRGDADAIVVFRRRDTGFERSLLVVPGPALSVAVSPDGRALAAGGRSADSAGTAGWAALWSIDGEPRAFAAEGRVHDDWVRCVRFSADGRRLVTASRDNTAKVWDLASASPRGPIVLGPHSGTVADACFSPDGATIATASTDGTVRLWSSRGEEEAVLRGHRGIVWQLAFSDDGRRLASASFDGTVRMWWLRRDDLLALARALVPRELTPEERRRYAELGLH
jgi:WD40 repeat protein